MDRVGRYSSGDEKQPKPLKDKAPKEKFFRYKKRPTQSNCTNGMFQDLFNRTLEERANELHSGGYWTPSNQKLYPAMSDPAVCGYPLPFSYSFDQVALPVYPVIPAAPVARTFKTLVSYPDAKPRKKRHEALQRVQKESQYTSLPPGSAGDSNSDQRRRFSDPGLANTEPSDESLSSSSSISDSEVQFMEQMNVLINENERLHKEIDLAKVELNSLKIEVSTLVDARNSYPIGAVTEMVKEVETALGMREEALLSKTKQLVKELVASSVHKNSVQNKEEERGPTKQEFEEMKKKLNEVTLERDMLGRRLHKLEEIVDNHIRNASAQELKQMSKLIVLEQEKKEMWRQLQEANKRTKQFISKIPSTLVGDDKDRCDGIMMSSMETSESLSSSIGSMSLHSPLMTMAGPVTDV